MAKKDIRLPWIQIAIAKELDECEFRDPGTRKLQPLMLQNYEKVAIAKSMHEMMRRAYMKGFNSGRWERKKEEGK